MSTSQRDIRAINFPVFSQNYKRTIYSELFYFLPHFSLSFFSFENNIPSSLDVQTLPLMHFFAYLFLPRCFTLLPSIFLSSFPFTLYFYFILTLLSHPLFNIFFSLRTFLEGGVGLFYRTFSHPDKS
jgi:hypothetical protein